MCAGAHATGAEALTATVANTGPAVMSKRTGWVALAAAALVMIGTTASASAREVVRYNAEVQPGTIVVKTAERWLYLVLGNGSAIRYTVADNPKLPDVIPGGAPNNPMGVAAMTLSGGEDAIHGTKRPDSIGKFASYSCIRMLNQDISDLFDRVDVGTQVVVLR